jgi:hypothetical protein
VIGVDLNLHAGVPLKAEGRMERLAATACEHVVSSLPLARAATGKPIVRPSCKERRRLAATHEVRPCFYSLAFIFKNHFAIK